MPPRKHQLENFDIAMRLRDREQRYRTVLNLVTPGGGKSVLPPIYAGLLIPHLADKICWLVPRQSLRRQAEEAFDTEWVQAWLGRAQRIRAAVNDVDPSRGLDGYTSTYQAVAQSPDLHLAEFQRFRYILVLDEPHHIDQGGVWHAAIQPLVERAVLTVLMTGTLERADGGRAAFVEYGIGTNGRETPALETTETRAVVTYSRGDALGERAIVPLEFSHYDLDGTWFDRIGERQTIESFDRLELADRTDAIYVGLNTEYANDLLARCVRDWQGCRQHYPAAQLLVVAHSQARAREYIKRLRQPHISVALAISDEGAEAQESIKLFRQQKRDVLVTVGMAYEGLDAPKISHIALLTHVRARPWIEQVLGRGVRRDGQHKAKCFIYAPDDPWLRDVIARIKAEQEPYVRLEGGCGPGGGPRPTGEIVPLEGSISGVRSSELDGESLDRDATARYEQAIAFSRIEGRVSPVELSRAFHFFNHAQVVVQAPARQTLTPSEIEDRLRVTIQSRANKIDRNLQRPFGTTNSELILRFRKSREHMTEQELQKVLAYVNTQYGDA